MANSRGMANISSMVKFISSLYSTSFNRSHDLLFIDIKTMYLGEMILPGIKREYGNWLASEMLELYLN